MFVIFAIVANSAGFFFNTENVPLILSEKVSNIIQLVSFRRQIIARQEREVFYCFSL